MTRSQYLIGLHLAMQKHKRAFEGYVVLTQINAKGMTMDELATTMNLGFYNRLRFIVRGLHNEGLVKLTHGHGHRISGRSSAFITPAGREFIQTLEKTIDLVKQ